MTRKDYIAIAATIAGARAECQASEFKIGVNTTAYRMADMLARDNIRFDRAALAKAQP